MVQERVRRLIPEAIERFELDLSGLTVLTEAATNFYALTPVIAAVAGAEKVFAVWGYENSLEDVQHVEYWKKAFGLTSEVLCCSRSNAPHADIVTNLGNVRLIDLSIARGSVVSLMMEDWEVREEDVDIKGLRENGVPMLATDEEVLGMWNYMGPLVLKMLFERGFEFYGSRILIVGDDRFAASAFKFLSVYDWVCWGGGGYDLDSFDVIVASGWYGNLDFGDRDVVWLTKNGRMMKTLADLGPKPLIELHTAGLKIGELLARTGSEEEVLGVCEFAQAYS